jgi:hypothetical protein
MVGRQVRGKISLGITLSRLPQKQEVQMRLKATLQKLLLQVVSKENQSTLILKLNPEKSILVVPKI